MKKFTIRQLTQAALIAALYIVLVFVFKPISFGSIQVRIAEVLTVLPFLTPSAIPGLFVGCLLANFLAGEAVPVDIIFGSLATLIAAFATYYLGKKSFPKWSAGIPPIISNMIIIPFILRYAYQIPGSIPFFMLTVGLGELVAAGILGYLFLRLISKYENILFKK